MICVIFVLGQISGCGKSPEKSPAKNNQSAAEEQKAPKELEDIKKKTEEIMKAIEKKKEASPNPQQDDSESKEEQKPEGDEKAEENLGDQEKADSAKNPKVKQGPSENWEEAETSAREIHLQWNAIETSVVKKDITNTLRTEFENNLNILTDSIISKNITDSLKYANEVYGASIKIDQLYEENNISKGEILKYYTQKALLELEEENWMEAKANISNLVQEIEKVKIVMVENKSKTILQLDYSVQDFLQAVEDNNKEIAKIKGEIVIKNIQKIIKEMEENKKNKKK